MNSSTKTASLLAGFALLAATALAQSSTGSSIRPTTSGSSRASGSSNTSNSSAAANASNSARAPAASNSSTTTTTTTTTPNANASNSANTGAATPAGSANGSATTTTSTPNTLNTPVLPASPGAPTATPHANDPLATDAAARSSGTAVDALTPTDAEKRAAEATRFKALDTDGDGRVSRAEYTLSSPRGLQGDSNVASDVTVRNSDAAFNARASSVEQFNQMDLNKDGFLSADELAMPMQ